MGWARWLFLGDLGQQLDLADRETEIRRLQFHLKQTTDNHMSAAQELERLAAENGELKLYVASILRVLLDKQVITQPELAALIKVVDREDGVEDGQRKGPLLDS